MLLWSVGHDRADLSLIPTPARRTLERVFCGAPDVDEIRALAADAQGAFVKISWEIGEESSASVDRGAIENALAGAAEVKLEGRIIPVVRSRAEGISRAATLEEKLKRWASLVDADPAPLSLALAELELKAPETIAAEVLGAPMPPIEVVVKVSTLAANAAREVETTDLFG